MYIQQIKKSDRISVETYNCADIFSSSSPVTNTIMTENYLYFYI